MRAVSKTGRGVCKAGLKLVQLFDTELGWTPDGLKGTAPAGLP